MSVDVGQSQCSLLTSVIISVSLCEPVAAVDGCVYACVLLRGGGGDGGGLASCRDAAAHDGVSEPPAC